MAAVPQIADDLLHHSTRRSALAFGWTDRCKAVSPLEQPVKTSVPAVLQRSKSRFGSPIAQQRLAARLRKAGGKGILDLRLRPGKRGNFVLSIVEWWVHDPVRNGMILRGGPLPDKPSLQCSATVWPYKRRNEQFTVTLFLMSHHAMQRLAERCGAPTPFDLLAAVDELWCGLELAINWHETVNKILAGERGVLMQRPKAIPVAGGKAVFEWIANRTLVVTTVLDTDMEV